MRGRHGEGKVNGTIRSIAMAIIAGALLAQGSAVAHAAPVTAQQITACDKRGGSLDTRIANCTTVIEGTRSAAVKKRARAHKIDRTIPRDHPPACRRNASCCPANGAIAAVKPPFLH